MPWKEVSGYPGYWVNETGLIWSDRLSDFTGKSINQSGYPVFRVRTGKGEGKVLYVHRCVAAEFLGKCPDGYEVGHLDGNPANNSVANLKYVSRLENQHHRVGHGTSNRGRKPSGRKLSVEEVRQIRERYQPHNKMNGARALSEDFGVSKQYIYVVVHNHKRKDAL